MFRMISIEENHEKVKGCPELGTFVLWILRSVLNLNLFLICSLNWSLFDIPHRLYIQSGVKGLWSGERGTTEMKRLSIDSQNKSALSGSRY